MNEKWRHSRNGNDDMAKTFSKLTRAAMRGLSVNGTITEHGISFERLADGDGRFTVNIMVDGQRIHRVVGKESDGTTRTQAEEFVAGVRQDAKHERLALPKNRKVALPFSEAAAMYLDRLGRADGKDLKSKRHRLTLHLVPYFGDTPLSRIDSHSLELYKKQRRAEPTFRGGVRRGKNAADLPVANSTKFSTEATINRELTVLSHLLNKAVEWGWIKASPVKVRRFQEHRTRFEYLTEAEIARLLHAAKEDSNSQIYTFVFVALHTAMRAGEILSLQKDFVDLGKGLIDLPRSKTGARTVPISPSLSAFLGRYLGTIEAGQPWLFPSGASKSGHTESLSKPWQRIVDEAGLAGRQISRHTLRHTAITHLVQAGVDLPTVQRISGHKSVQMVVRYSHQNSQHVQDALAKLDLRIVAPPSLEVTATGDQHDYTGTTQARRYRSRRARQVLEGLVPAPGIEPGTFGLQNRCSTN